MPPLRFTTAAALGLAATLVGCAQPPLRAASEPEALNMRLVGHE